jgi:hypothetical protein
MFGFGAIGLSAPKPAFRAALALHQKWRLNFNYKV